MTSVREKRGSCSINPSAAEVAHWWRGGRRGRQHLQALEAAPESGVLVTGIPQACCFKLM